MLFSSIVGPLETSEASIPPIYPQKLVGIQFVGERERWKTPPTGIVVIGHGPWPSFSHSKYGGSFVSYDLFILDSDYLNSEIVLLRAIQSVLEGISQVALDRGGNCVLNLILTIDPFHEKYTEDTGLGIPGILIEAGGTSSYLETMDEWMDRKYGLGA
jgi:hypothetical protein